MSHPKPPDLTAEAIQKVIREALNMEGVTPCYRIQEGSIHNVWTVGSNIVLRGLPATGRLNGGSEASMKRNTAVSNLLRKYLSNPDVIAEILATVTIDGWICTLERRFHGNTLKTVTSTERNEEDLVEFIKDLGSVPIEEAREAVTYEEERPNIRRQRFRALRASDDLVKNGRVQDPECQIDALLKSKLALVESLKIEEEYKPVLLHADISGEHIFIHPTTGALEGIIDWSQARLGDPCRDIAGLALSVGRNMAKSIGMKADYPEYTVERGLLYAMCLTVRNLVDYKDWEGTEERELLRNQFRRAFKGTGMEGVEVGF